MRGLGTGPAQAEISFSVSVYRPVESGKFFLAGHSGFAICRSKRQYFGGRRVLAGKVREPTSAQTGKCFPVLGSTEKEKRKNLILL